MKLNLQQIVWYCLGLCAQKPGLREVDLEPSIKFPINKEELQKAPPEFQIRFGFPQVIGCIDGTQPYQIDQRKTRLITIPTRCFTPLIVRQFVMHMINL